VSSNIYLLLSSQTVKVTTKLQTTIPFRSSLSSAMNMLLVDYDWIMMNMSSYIESTADIVSGCIISTIHSSIPTMTVCCGTERNTREEKKKEEKQTNKQHHYYYDQLNN